MGVLFVVIEYITILVFCYIGIKYVLSETVAIRNPFNKNTNVIVPGDQAFLLFTLATGIFMVGSLSATKLLIWIVYFIFCIIRSGKRISFTLPVILYLLFIIWLIISLVYVSPYKMYGMRVFLKYLYPFVVMILAIQITNTRFLYLSGIRNVMRMAIWGLVIFFILVNIPFVRDIMSVLFWTFPAFADFLPVAVGICLTNFLFFKKFKYLVYVAISFLICVTAANRTGLIAVSMASMAYFIIRYKLRSLPYILFSIAIFFLVILYVPGVRDKMFKEQLTADEIMENRENISSNDIDSSGRFAMWEWSLNKFYEDNKWVGSGLGVLQETFYTFKHPFGTIRIVHNDYVQILCDTGLIGMILYGSTLLTLIIHSFIIYTRRNSPTIIRYAAIISFIGMTGMVSTLMTDNVVNYSLLTLSYPFGLYGMMIGLKNNQAVFIKK